MAFGIILGLLSPVHLGAYDLLSGISLVLKFPYIRIPSSPLGLTKCGSYYQV